MFTNLLTRIALVLLCSQMNATLEQISEKLRTLKIGHSISVATDNERRHALTASRVLGKRVVSKRVKSGGFTITALPDN